MKLLAFPDTGHTYVATTRLTSYLAPMQVVVGAMLLLVVMMSSFSSVYVKYMNRELTDQLDQLNKIRVQQETEYSQLILERAALTNQERVHNMARNQLGMYVPDAKEMHTVKNNASEISTK